MRCYQFLTNENYEYVFFCFVLFCFLFFVFCFLFFVLFCFVLFFVLFFVFLFSQTYQKKKKKKKKKKKIVPLSHVCVTWPGVLATLWSKPIALLIYVGR